MILLLGATGYIGKAFASELARRKKDFTPLSRGQVDYTRFDVLLEFLKTKKAGVRRQRRRLYGQAQRGRLRTAQGRHVAGQHAVSADGRAGLCGGRHSMGHVSSGCIYSGAKIVRTGRRARKRISPSRNSARWLKNLRKPSTASPRPTPQIFLPRRPVQFLQRHQALGEEAIAGIARVTSGGCDSVRRVRQRAELFEQGASVIRRFTTM